MSHIRWVCAVVLIVCAGPIACGGSERMEPIVVAGREPARRAFAVAPPPSLVSPAVLSAASSVRIIAGNRDGIAPAQAFRDLTASSPGVVVETLLEADHFFSSDLGTITRFAERAAEADA